MSSRDAGFNLYSSVHVCCMSSLYFLAYILLTMVTWNAKTTLQYVNLEHSSNSLGLNSIQTLCLVKNSPLIFGDVVPQVNRNWNLLFLLWQIINTIFSPIVFFFFYGMTVYLNHLIKEQHQIFWIVYTNQHLIPQHHFMVLYLSCISKIGPLLHTFVWGKTQTFQELSKEL